jgi:hypothetical protein
VPIPFNLLGHDIMKYPLLFFLPAVKEADLAEMACVSMPIIYKAEGKP